MALPSAPHAPAQQQHQSSGVGMQGAQPVVGPQEAAKPVLFEDIDPVLLIRLYPGAKDVAELRAQAMAAGQLVHDEGAKLIAAQQQPVEIAGEPPRAGPGPHREA